MQDPVELDASQFGRQSDGTPSYPYITGYLVGRTYNTIERLKSGYTTEEVISYLQETLKQENLWSEPFDSPTTNIHAAHTEEEE